MWIHVHNNQVMSIGHFTTLFSICLVQQAWSKPSTIEIIGPKEEPTDGLLIARLSKCLLNVYASIRWFVRLPTLVREFSFYTRYQLMQRFITVQRAEKKWLWVLCDRRNICIIIHRHTHMYICAHTDACPCVAQETWNIEKNSAFLWK